MNIFKDLHSGERFCWMFNPATRYQKIDAQYAVNLTRGCDKGGYYILEYLHQALPVIPRPDSPPAVVYIDRLIRID